MTHALRSAESSHRVLANRQQVDAWRTGMLERERWPREQLLAYQQSSLSEIVQYAAANSPYYGEILGDVRDGEIDLQQLPVLTKTTLMGEFDRIVTDRRLRLAD